MRIPPFAALAAMFVSSSSTLLLSGCDEQKKTDSLRPSYERPTPAAARPNADRACTARLAKGELTLASETFSLRVTGSTDKGVVHLADVSVLGGPFEAPLAATVPPGAYPVRLVVDKQGLGRCVRLTIAERAAASEAVVGDVAIDSGTLVLGDAVRLGPFLRDQPGHLYAGFEGPAGEMEGLAKALEPKLPTERVLPTYYRATRALGPLDLDLVKGAIQNEKSHARALVEPRPAAWPLVAALGDGKVAASGHAGPDSAVLVDVPAGDGAYLATASKDADGTLVALTVSLER